MALLYSQSVVAKLPIRARDGLWEVDADVDVGKARAYSRSSIATVGQVGVVS